MIKMIKNTYKNGRCDIINRDTGIILMPDHRIYYCYFTDEDEADYKYDMLSEVGEIWKQDILDILAEHNIVTGHFENLTDYHDTWISFDQSEWIDMDKFKKENL